MLDGSVRLAWTSWPRAEVAARTAASHSDSETDAVAARDRRPPLAVDPGVERLLPEQRLEIRRRDEDGERIPMDVAEGDRVLFQEYAGTEVIVDGEELLIMDESDVLAVVA